MLRELTAREYRDWQDYYGAQPFGEVRADIRHGIACSLMDACHRAKGQPEPPVHYMPFAERHRLKPRKSLEQMKAIAEQVKRAWAK